MDTKKSPLDENQAISVFGISHGGPWGGISQLPLTLVVAKITNPSLDAFIMHKNKPGYKNKKEP